VEHERGRLLRVLDGNKAHGRALGCFTDRLGIGRIILLPLHKGLT
jgi:hypothetical protein